MTTGFVWDERFAWHDAGRASDNLWAEPYPALDRPEAKRRLLSLVEASGLSSHLSRLPARPAVEAELLRFHSRDYVRRIAALSASGGGDAGEAAGFGPNDFEVARLAAGGCIAAVDAVLHSRARPTTPMRWSGLAATMPSPNAAAASASSATSCWRSGTRAPSMASDASR